MNERLNEGIRGKKRLRKNAVVPSSSRTNRSPNQRTETTLNTIPFYQGCPEIEDLFNDLKDGKRLMDLLEIIAGKKIGKPNKGVLR